MRLCRRTLHRQRLSLNNIYAFLERDLFRDRIDYARRPDGKSLAEALISHGAHQVNNIHAGDVLLFRYDGQPQHVALATSDTTMIHSFAPAGAVVETLIGDYWQRRLVGVYSFMI